MALLGGEPAGGNAGKGVSAELCCKKMLALPLLYTKGPAYRLRVGDYRIIYTIDDGVLLIVVITLGHRRDVYE